MAAHSVSFSSRITPTTAKPTAGRTRLSDRRPAPWMPPETKRKPHRPLPWRRNSNAGDHKPPKINPQPVGSDVRYWLSADVPSMSKVSPLSVGRRTFNANVCFAPEFVCFTPKTGRNRYHSWASANDPGCVKTRTSAKWRGIFSQGPQKFRVLFSCFRRNTGNGEIFSSNFRLANVFTQAGPKADIRSRLAPRPRIMAPMRLRGGR